MICRLCKEQIIIEELEGVYHINPNTFRFCWMHFDCYITAMEELMQYPAKNPVDYENRQDEYISFVANRF